MIGMKLNQPLLDVGDAIHGYALTSMVCADGMWYVKLPVLKSLLRPPIEIISFAFSAFFIISGRVRDTT
jgi:hypothetical protein